MSALDQLLPLPGLLTDVAEDDYHADKLGEGPSLSSSVAKVLIAKSPLHAWSVHPRLNPDYLTREATMFDIGSAAHALLLQGDDIAEILDYPDFKTNAAKDARDEARRAGMVPLLRKHADSVRAMVEAARIQLDGFGDPTLFTEGEPETTLLWQEGDVTCRARLDWLRHDRSTIDDYKTTSVADPRQWTRTHLFKMGYDISAAFYLRGAKALTGSAPEFRWCVQETAPPYAISVVRASPEVLENAARKVAAAIGTWGECLRTNVWPGWARDVYEAPLTAWAAMEEEE